MSAFGESAAIGVSGSGSVRVLVLEPSAEVRNRLVALLDRSGHRVEVAADSSAARALARQAKDALTLLNIGDADFAELQLLNVLHRRSNLIVGLAGDAATLGHVISGAEIDDFILLDSSDEEISIRLALLTDRASKRLGGDGAMPALATTAETTWSGDGHAFGVAADRPESDASSLNAQHDRTSGESRFQTLIEHSSDALLIVDLHGVITWMSPALERALGRRADERIGRSVFEYVVPEDQSLAHDAHAQVLARPGRTHSVLVRARAANNTIRVFHFAARRIVDDEIDGIVLNGRDVTEMIEIEEKLRRSEEALRITLDSGGMAAWQVDLERSEIVLSPEAAALFGDAKTERRLAFEELASSVHPDDRHAVSAENLLNRTPDGTVGVEFRAALPDGSVRWIEAKGRASFDLLGDPVSVTGVMFDITARKAIESELRAERATLDMLMEHDPDAIYIKDRHSRFVRANTTMARHFGFDDSSALIGKTVFDLFLGDRAHSYFADEQRVMETGATISNRLDHHDDAPADRWSLTSLAPIRDERSDIIGVIGTSRDVTHYGPDDRQLAIAEMRYRLVVEQIPAITSIYSINDEVQTYEYISPQVLEILGFKPEEYAKIWIADPASLFHPDDAERMTQEIQRVNSGHGTATVEYRHRTKGGGWKWVRELASPLPGNNPDHRRWQSIMFDLTEDRALTDRLEHQVLHDHLTGLPNRLLLSRRLDEVVARAPRGFALLFIDLDDFKRINDSRGHHSGDAALIAVAERLKHLIRADDTVARLSGDEFVVLLSEISGPRNAHDIAVRVQRAFAEPFLVDDVPLTLSASIGVGIHNQRPLPAVNLLREADAAMYEAKRSGRGRIRFFDAPGLDITAST